MFQTHPAAGDQGAGSVWCGVEGSAGRGAGGRQDLPPTGQAVMVRRAGDLQPAPDVPRERAQVHGQVVNIQCYESIYIKFGSGFRIVVPILDPIPSRYLRLRHKFLITCFFKTNNLFLGKNLFVSLYIELRKF